MFRTKEQETLAPLDFMPYQPRREMTEEEAQADYDRRLQKAINAMKVYSARCNAIYAA